MEHEQLEKDIARESLLIYLPISAGAALLFLAATNFTGDYTLVARVGGAVWIGLLGLIVSMPVVTSAVKKRHQNR